MPQETAFFYPFGEISGLAELATANDNCRIAKETVSKLDSEMKREAQETLVGLEPLAEADWIGENPELRALIKQGSANFTEWRYVPEPGSKDGGVPKVLVNVIQVLRALRLQRTGLADVAVRGVSRAACHVL